jgi:hypothetical protein
MTSATEGWGIERLREDIDNQLSLLRVPAGTATVS